jgi:hypothetical protein
VVGCLSCFYSVSSVIRGDLTTRFSVGWRRPQILEWTPHHSYCCQTLQEGGQVNDLRLVRIVQLQKMAQDVSRTFCYDTRPKSIFTDPASILTRRIVRSFCLSHRQGLPPTTRIMARTKPHPRRIRILLVPPNIPLSTRSSLALLPQHRRPPSTFWFQR